MSAVAHFALPDCPDPAWQLSTHIPFDAPVQSVFGTIATTGGGVPDVAGHRLTAVSIAVSLRALAQEHALLWAQWTRAAVTPGSFEKDCLKEAAHHGRMAARYEQEARAA